MQVLDLFKFCEGIPDSCISLSDQIKKHIVYKTFQYNKEDEKIIDDSDMDISSSSETEDDNYLDQNNNNNQVEYNRHVDCLILYKFGTKSCLPCRKISVKGEKEINKINKLDKSKKPAVAIKPNAPISQTSSERLLVTIRQQRSENKRLTNEISQMKEELIKLSVPVSEELSNDFKSIFNNCTRNVSPFMKLFWEEQLKYIKSSPNEVKYHPMIIKYCLGIYAKSPAAYEQLRYNEKEGSGVLVLPSQRTLRDYKNYIRPQRGFNDNVINELAIKTKEFTAAEKFVILCFDEMKIQDDLVWDKHTGELIGFVDLGDIDLNYATLNKVDKIASHVLVFLVKSVINPLSFSLAIFPTEGAKCIQLFPIFWRAVAILEMRCFLKVIAVSCDGASANRKFFRMHSVYENNNDKPVTYKTPNIITQIYMFFC